MFVSTPSQISADAAQTGMIGPSVPATAGTDGGFAAWLTGGAKVSGEAAAATVPANTETATLQPTQVPPFAAGTHAGPLPATPNTPGTGTAAETMLQASILNGSAGQGAAALGSGAQGAGGQGAGAQGDAWTALVNGDAASGIKTATAGQLAGQTAAAQTGDAATLLSQQKSGTAALAQTDTETAETALNRFGVPTSAKDAVEPFGKHASGSASPAIDPSGTGHRASSETGLQGQTQQATVLQSTDSGFRSTLPQAGISQAPGHGLDGAGQPKPTINSADVAVQMARNKADGKNQFTIRLTPESMGTITVKLNITNNANLTAQLQVEKPETLAMLQKDLAGLEKALKAQGFTTGDGDLTIALKPSGVGVRGGEAAMNSGADQRFGQGQNMSQNQGQAHAQNQAGSQNQGPSAQPAPAHPAPSGAMDRPAPGMLLSSGDMGFQQSHQERGAKGHDGFDQSPNGQGSAEPDDLEPGHLEHLDLIASAYHGRNLLIGMSTQLDLSV